MKYLDEIKYVCIVGVHQTYNFHTSGLTGTQIIFICLSLCLSVNMFVWPRICLLINYICLYVCLTVCLYHCISLSVELSIFFYALCHQFRLLILTLFIGSLFIQYLGRMNKVKRMNGGIVIVASLEYYFIRVYDNLV